MSLSYGFYNSINGDRKYNAEQLSSIFDGIINDGIFMSVGDAMMVVENSGMIVRVGTGRAWFNHTWTNIDADILLTIDDSEIAFDRIDVIVLEVDSSEETRENSIKIIKGEPSLTPSAPTLTNTDNVHQHPLAHIYIGAGVTEIVTANITNKVGTGDCPFVTGILETINTDALLAEWDSEYQIWLTAIQNLLSDSTVDINEMFSQWGVDADAMFAQWGTDFNTWFDTIQDILDTNTAGNLLTLINANTSEINTIKGEIHNPAFAATQVSANTVNSLPSTSQGLLDKMVVKGRTITNLLPDTITESISGWTESGATGAIDSSNKLQGTNCLKVTPSASNGNYYYDIFSLVSASKYYLLTVYIKNYNMATGGRIYFRGIGTNDNVLQSATVSATTYTRVGVIVQPSDMTNLTQARFGLQGVCNGSEYAYFDALTLREISASDYALGATTLLEKYPFHLGTKSVDKMRIKSIGKNLLPMAIGGVTQNGVTISVDTNGEFTLNGTASADTRFTLFNDIRYGASASSITNNGSPLIRKSANVSVSYSGITGSKTGTVRLLLAATGGVLANTNGTNLGLGTAYANLALSYDINSVYTHILSGAVFTNYKFKLQIEYGATSTSYESYQQSQSVCSLPLAGVPAIADTWDALKGVHTKNVQEYTLLSGDITVFNNTTYTNNYVTIAKTVFQNSSTWSNQVEGKLKIIGFPSEVINEVASYNDITKIYNFSTSTSVLVLVLPAGLYANLSAAQMALAGTKIYYELATPVTTYLQPVSLLGSALGTIIQERFVEDYGFYNSGLSLSDGTKFITHITECRKWNLNDGSYVVIPNSNITVTAGAITAITNAINGEFYTFDYNYDEFESTNGELNYSYSTNIVGQVQTNIDSIVKLEKNLNDKTINIPSMIDKIEALSNNTKKYGESAAGTDTYAITTTFKYPSYNAGMIVYLKADVGNTGASTLNVDGLGVKNIKILNSAGKVDTKTGDIIANGIYSLVYDGVDFILTNPNSILQSIVTARGDIIRASGANATERLALGTTGKALISNGTDVVYGNPNYTIYIPSNNVLASYATEMSTSLSSYVQVIAFNLARRGYIRLKFEGRVSTGTYGYLGVFSPGDVLIAEYNFSGTSYVAYSLDLGDVGGSHAEAYSGYRIKIKHSSGNSVYVRNLSICADEYNPTTQFVY